MRSAVLGNLHLVAKSIVIKKEVQSVVRNEYDVMKECKDEQEIRRLLEGRQLAAQRVFLSRQ